MSEPSHQLIDMMIRASAGTGKTHSLSNRYLQLMAQGASPESIVALTFTRKAAAEFSSRILTRLAEAAQDSGKAKALSKELELSESESNNPHYPKLLRSLLDSLPLLRLETIDAFSVSILQAFGHEFGSSAKLQLFDEISAEVAQRQSLEELFTNSDSETRRQLVEMFQVNRFGREESSLFSLFNEALKKHGDYLSHPDPQLWGNLDGIWGGEPSWWLELNQKEVTKEVHALQSAFEKWAESREAEGQGAPSPSERKSWLDLAESLAYCSPSNLPKKFNALHKTCLAQLPEILSGETSIMSFRKERHLPQELCLPLGKLLSHQLSCAYKRQQLKTRGLYQLLSLYEEQYHRLFRARGMMSFRDVELLLSGKINPQDERSLRQFSTSESPEILNINYRIDGKYDHWLVDEFQDTSREQWKILKNLIEEAISDSARSFFFVGDNKQAIYGWRGGDARLFSEIIERYAAGGMQTKELHDSYRSGPQIIKYLNAVFSSETLSEIYGKNPSNNWIEEWKEHQSAKKELPSLVELTVCEEKISPPYNPVIEILERAQPLEKGKSCAVLFRKNESANLCVEALRKAGIECSIENDQAIAADNPVSTLFLALLQYANNPADSAARQHLQMSPLVKHIGLSQINSANPRTWLPSILKTIHEEGFEALCLKWIHPLRREGVLIDPYSKQRLQQLLELCANFDRQGSKDIDLCLLFLEKSLQRQGSRSDLVQVMTIHKAKGLSFDMVICPEIEHKMSDKGGLAIAPAAPQEAKWILELPNQLYRNADPKVEAAQLTLLEKENHEALCNLYVALTRASQGLYLVVEKSSKINHLLSEGFADEAQKSTEEFQRYTQGEADWAESSKDKAEQTPRNPIAPIPPSASELYNGEAINPSSLASHLQQEAKNEGQKKHGLSATEYGNLVHELWEQIEWYDGNITLKGEGSAFEAASKEIQACLAKKPIAEIMNREHYQNPLLWREKEISSIRENTKEYIHGYIDRTVIERDEDGEITAATVIDYKTNNIEKANDLKAIYSEQMRCYREALCALLDIEKNKVRLLLLSTQHRELVEVS